MTGPLRIGVVTPHLAPGPEVELPALGHDVELGRTGPPPTAGNPSVDLGELARAVQGFAGAGLDAVAHASTTTGYVVGAAAEAELVARLADLSGVPAVATCAAAAAELRTAGVTRVQLVHPPWFDPGLDELGARYFRAQGHEVVVSRATDLPVDPALVQPDQVLSWVERHADPRAGGIFLAGNGFRTASMAEELARRTGEVVVTANRTLLAAVLRALGRGT